MSIKYLFHTQLQNHHKHRPNLTDRLFPLLALIKRQMPKPFLVLASFCILLIIAGCGPEEGSSNRDQLSAETKRIAQEFNITQDLNNARTQLAALDVANAEQWLLLVTEKSIAENVDLGSTVALVKLTRAMGLETATVATFAQQNNLVEQVASTQDVVINIEPKLQPLPAAGSVADAAAENTAPQKSAPDVDDSDADSQQNGDAAPAATATVESAVSPTVPPTTAPIAPSVTAVNGLNVRSGPSIAHTIVGAMETGTTAALLAKNPQGDWWQVALPDGTEGWVFGPLVTTVGDVSAIAVAANIPTPPPAPTAAPTAVPEPVVEAPPAPDTSGPEFRLIERRLWSVEENGGRMDGPSVICGEKRELRVKVVDAAGNPMNGVAVQEVYGAKVIEVTGAQGKGDGIAEFILGDGQDIKVIRVGDRDVSSDVATGLSTIPAGIDFPSLIQAGFCTDDASCQKNIVDVYACGGHYSWSVTFQSR